MNGGTPGFTEPDDGALDFGGGAPAEVKALAQRLNPAAAEAYADYLTLIIERMSELAAAYVQVSGELESWQSDAGALCADRLATMSQHAKGILDIATEVRAAMLEAAGAAAQTRNRTTGLDDWRVPYTSAISRGNDENMQSAKDFLDDLDGSLLRTIAVLDRGLSSVIDVVNRIPPRGELLRDPYGTAGERVTGGLSPASALGAVADAGMENDPLARTLPLSRPGKTPSYPAPIRRMPVRDELAATSGQVGVFGESGFDDHTADAASAAPQLSATDWLSTQETERARGLPWRGALIGDEDPLDLDAAQRITRPIISAYDYERPSSGRDSD